MSHPIHGAGGSRTRTIPSGSGSRFASNRNNYERFRRGGCGLGCGPPFPPLTAGASSRYAMVVPRASSNPSGHVTLHTRPILLGEGSQSASTRRHSRGRPHRRLPPPPAHGHAPLPHRPAPPRDIPGPGRGGRSLGRACGGVGRGRSSGPTSAAASWPTASPASAATTAAPSAWWPSPARAAASAPPATPAGWSRWPPT